MQKLTGTGFLIFTFLLCAGTLTSQEYRIHNYGVTEGIVHPFVYTINQDINGYIWVGTGEGLCRFNGFTFDTDLIQDSLAGQVAGVSYKDSRQYLWFGYQNGNLGRYDGYTLQMVHH
jgi:ligand-binding sensor domain-containing protein